MRRDSAQKLKLERTDLYVFLGCGAVGLVAVLLAALGFSWLGGAGILYLVGYTVAAGAHGCVAALVVAVVAVALHDDWTNFRTVHQVVMAVVAALLLIGAVLLDRWLVDLHLSAASTIVYFVLAALAVVAAGVVTWFTLDRDHFTGSPEAWSVTFADAMTGVVAGAAVMVLVVVGLAYVRQMGVAHAHVPSLAARVIGGEYVAIGDSYSAGEGLRPFNPGTDSDCHRSEQAYSQVLAFRGVRPAERFAACSGAVVNDVFTGFDGRPPQVDNAKHPEVRLVTLTMSGNDMLFSKIVVACFLDQDCLSAAFGPVQMEKGRFIDYPAVRMTLKDWARATATILNPNILNLYAHLARDEYPNARIVVVGYPYLFPAGPAPWWPNDCTSILRRFSHAERIGIRNLQDQFNNMLYADAVASGLEFVSPVAAWDGHEPCGPRGQFTNSIKPVISKNPIDGGTFHPNANGQKEFAYLVACYLDSHPTPPDPYVGGVSHPVNVSGLVSDPALVGLIDPPGSKRAPLHC